MNLRTCALFRGRSQSTSAMVDGGRGGERRGEGVGGRGSGVGSRALLPPHESCYYFMFRFL